MCSPTLSTLTVHFPTSSASQLMAILPKYKHIDYSEVCAGPFKMLD